MEPCHVPGTHLVYHSVLLCSASAYTVLGVHFSGNVRTVFGYVCVLASPDVYVGTALSVHNTNAQGPSFFGQECKNPLGIKVDYAKQLLISGRRLGNTAVVYAFSRPPRDLELIYVVLSPFLSHLLLKNGTMLISFFFLS